MVFWENNSLHAKSGKYHFEYTDKSGDKKTFVSRIVQRKLSVMGLQRLKQEYLQLLHQQQQQQQQQYCQNASTATSINNIGDTV